MKNAYELMMVISSSAGLDEKTIKANVKKHAGEESTVESVKDYGKRTLAYPIRKQHDANYWLVTFTSTGTGTVTLSKKLRLDEHVLRFLVVKKDK